MSANIELVKTGFELFFAGDIPGFIEMMSADVVWDHTGPEDVPINGIYKGRDGGGEFFKILGETQESLEFEPREHVGYGDRVVTLGYFKWNVKATSKQWESNFAFAFTIKDGHITHWQPYFDMTASALAHRA